MNSRQRIKKAINHQEPDRIPIDLGSFGSSGISTIAYNKLRSELGIEEGLPKMYAFITQLAYPEKEVLKRFKVDTIDPGQNFLKQESDWREWETDDGRKCLIPGYLDMDIDNEGTVFLKNTSGLYLGKKPRTSLYVDQFYWVYKDIPSIPDKINSKDLEKVMWRIPSPPWHLDVFDNKQFKSFLRGIEELYQRTERSIIISVGGSLFEYGTYLRGFENFLCDIYTDKTGTARLLDLLVENKLKLLDRVLKPVSKFTDVLLFGGEDLGSQDRPFMSPEIFREIFKPRHKKIWDFVHNNSDCKVMLHSCGSIYELLPELIDIGLDILNPVQTTAKNMDANRLKKEFGKDLVFWGGGCNTRDILARGTRKDVREDVKRNIDILGKDGGFVFTQIHNILADVPPENIVTMLDTAYEYGSY